MPFLSTLPFWLHLLIELPASLNFLLNPSEQLASPAPQAHAIIRQYGILLLSTNIIALVFGLRRVDVTSRNVAGALAVYHLAPFMRAVGRVLLGEAGYGKGLGGPWAHLGVHGICLVALAQCYSRGRLRRRAKPVK